MFQKLHKSSNQDISTKQKTDKKLSKKINDNNSKISKYSIRRLFCCLKRKKLNPLRNFSFRGQTYDLQQGNETLPAGPRCSTMKPYFDTKIKSYSMSEQTKSSYSENSFEISQLEREKVSTILPHKAESMKEQRSQNSSGFDFSFG